MLLFTSGALLSKIFLFTKAPEIGEQKISLNDSEPKLSSFKLFPPVQREGFPYINVSGWEKLIQFLLKKCVLNTKIIVVIPLVLFGRHSRLYTKLIKKKRSSINYYYYIRVFL